MKKIYVIGGGTISHVRNHLALCTPAFGTTAVSLYSLCSEKFKDMKTYAILTRMADSNSSLETNEDVAIFIKQLKMQKDTGIIFFNVAMCDWKGDIATRIDTEEVPIISGKYSERLRTSDGLKMMMLTPAEKVIKSIRDNREDIFVVGFKTTCGASEADQYLVGLNLLKESNLNLVLANDTKTRMNMIIDGSKDQPFVTIERIVALAELVNKVYQKVST